MQHSATAATNCPAPFFWGDIELSQTVFVNGVPLVTRRAIGEWLEYAEPVKAISKIIERNPHLQERSVVVNLTTTDHKRYEVEVFQPMGFLDRIAKTRDAFVRAELTRQYRALCLAAGEPGADVSLIGKDVDQLPLPGMA